MEVQSPALNFHFSYNSATGQSTSSLPSEPESPVPGVRKIWLDRWDTLTEEQQYQIVATRPKPNVERYNPDDVPGGKAYYTSDAYRGSIQYPTTRCQSATPNMTRAEMEIIVDGNPKSSSKQLSKDFCIARPKPYCEEYLGRYNFSPRKYVRFRNKSWSLWPMQNERFAQERAKAESYYRYYLPSGNASTIASFFGTIAFFLFLAIGIIFYNSLQDTATAVQMGNWAYFKNHVLLVLGFYLGLIYICLMLSYFLPKDEDYIEFFDRKAGMFVSKEKLKKTRKIEIFEIPFSDCYPRFVTIRQEGFSQLCFSRRQSIGDVVVRIPTNFIIDSYLNYYLICHFMDIERPLPDIPELEPYRHLDPVTAEHDRRTNRPPRYWRDKSYREIKKMVKESRKRAMDILGPI